MGITTPRAQWLESDKISYWKQENGREEKGTQKHTVQMEVYNMKQEQYTQELLRESKVQPCVVQKQRRPELIDRRP